MKLRILLALFVIVLYAKASTANSSREAEKELIDLYQSSMPAVMGMLSMNKTLDVLFKNFLTNEKADSIWPKALAETKQWFGEDHELGELQAIENDLKKYRIILSRCMKENAGKELTRCLSTVKNALVAGSGNVEWSREQEIPKQLNLYTSFHLMELGLLQMLKMQQEKDPIDGLNVDTSIKEVAKNFKETLEASMPKACEQRKQQISPLDLCKVADVLWQEFKLKCEERVKKRSVEDEEDNSSGNEDEEANGDVRSSFTEENYGKIKSSKLGGNQNDFVESVRATVQDRVTGQYIYNKRLSSSPNFNKAKLLQTLQDEGLNARNKHVKAVDAACKKYWDERGKPIAEKITELIDFPKKKKKAHKKKSKKKEKKEANSK